MRAITKERIGELLKTALTVVEENGGALPGREVIRRAGERLRLTDYERQRYEKTGYVRWESIIHFYSIECVKAGWLQKDSGTWYLTDEGRRALKLPPLAFLVTAQAKYREWRGTRPAAGEVAEQETAAEPGERIISRQTAYEQAIALARAEIESYTDALGPYEFQDLVAALLRGMGYYTPFVSPQGRDGGIDVLAYKDPLGSTTPRIKVQVKHRSQKVTAGTVRELVSLLNKEGDIGLIVSSGGFTTEVATEIRRAARHIEKIDLGELIRLWEEHYDRMRDEDKLKLRIRRVAFLAATEE